MGENHMPTDASDEALRLDHQLCFPLYAASRRIVNLYTPLLKPLGLTYTQYLVLMALWEQDAQTVGELCKRLFLDSGTVTPLLKKMESAGFLRRTRCGRDERVVIVTLTEEGKAVRERVRTLPEMVGACIRLSSEQKMALYHILHQLLQDHTAETES